MTIGQLLGGSKVVLYKLANANEKALRDEKRIKIEQLRQQKLKREAQRLPMAWMDDKPIQLTSEIF